MTGDDITASASDVIPLTTIQDDCRPVLTQGKSLARLTPYGRVYLFATVDSTNAAAKRLAAKGEQAVVVAETQTKGRGRLGRSWWSGPGGLYFSWLVFPSDAQQEMLPLVTLIAGVACAEAIEEVAGLKPEIAWPNDLLLDGFKIAGILCERKGKALVFGCGVNVDQKDFPGELTGASSLRLQSRGREYDRFGLLVATMARLKRWFDNLSPANSVPIMGAIRTRMALIDRAVTVTIGIPGLGSFGAQRVSGTAVDVDEQGRLVLRTGIGKLLNVSAGTARLTRPDPQG